MKKLFLLLLALAVNLTGSAALLRVEFNGQQAVADFSDVTANKLQRGKTPWVKPELRSSHLLFTGKCSKNWQQFECAFTPRNSGKIRLLLRSNYAAREKVQWVEYDRLEITGAAVKNPSFENLDRSGNITGWRLRQENMLTGRPDAADGKNHIRAGHDFYVMQDVAVTAGKRVTLRFAARSNGKVETAPAASSMILKKSTPVKLGVTNYPREYYRYYDAKVKLLPLKNKGITPEQITLERDPGVMHFSEADFAVPAAGKNRTDALQVPLELLEESGISRIARVRCGIPLPEAQFYDLNSLRITDPAGKIVPAQFAALGFWRDGSVKWVLAQFDAPLQPHEKSLWQLTASDREVPAFTAVKVTNSADTITVNTGKLSAVIDKKHFALLRDVRVNGSKTGSFLPLTVRDEHGKVWHSSAFAPDKITLEESGAYHVVVKVSGSYGNTPDAPGKYVVRIGFTAGSAAVDFTITHINSRLTTEFTDLTSLVLPFVPEVPARILTMEFAPGSAMQTLSIENGRFFQQDEKTLAIYGSTCQAQLTGAGRAGNLTFALRDAAFRYPKAFSISNNAVNFELLPALPDAKFGTKLPHYLQFPFCEGKYRLKWGMSFTEHLTIDFSGETDHKTLAAKEIIPVIDRKYLASTGVIPGVTAEKISLFDRWDQAATAAFYEHLKIKAAQREYGFLNYGDWFGERGRNWGNNEYDMAHGLFMLFSRTGNRDLFRWALTAARHQADVDIIHAYVDPVYIGANAQHGIGHTGINHQRVYPGSWSWPIDYSFLGQNGHTWSNGMLDAWCFAGDAAVMDSALKLGEHLTCITANRLKKLGTHERSVGWSVKALLAYYNVTGQQKYLDAASKLIKIALQEQKFDQGGAWPHKLPPGHSGGYKNAFGNTPFLIGTLLGALREYHRFTNDPAVAKSIIAAGLWQQRNWSDSACGFPYTASWDHKPYFPHRYSLNGLVAPGITYRALLTGDRTGFDIGSKTVALDNLVGITPDGKSLAIKLVYANDLMEDLLQFRRRYPDKSGIELTLQAMLKLFRPEKLSFKARAPERKEFIIILNAPEAEFIATRTRVGSRPEPKPQWSLQLLAPDGKILAQETRPITQDHTAKFKISGKIGDVFRLVLDDDMTAFWDVPPGKGFQAFIKLDRQSAFSAAHPAAYYFTVPAGTEQFTITLGGVHVGPFNGWIIRPDGTVAGQISGVNSKISLPWTENRQKTAASCRITPDNRETQIWKLLIFAAGDIRINVNGLPPYLSTAPHIWEKK